MNIVIVTTLSRPQLLLQTINSLRDNAAHADEHHVTVVLDGYGSALMRGNLPRAPLPVDVMVNLAANVGASRARNIGAGSIPRYRRQEHVLFCDDDIYACPGWDRELRKLAKWAAGSILSGYSHPYNQCEKTHDGIKKQNAIGEIIELEKIDYGVPLVISSVAMMMPWHIFDECGPWDEPGGPGGSEDYALCMRAKGLEHGFAVTDPQCIIHTGMMSSAGKFIVGYKELAEHNQQMVDFYGLQGKVLFD